MSLPFQPNTLYYADCLDVMGEWVQQGRTVDLIYLDPPFNSNADYNVLYGKDQTGKPREERAQFVAFNDTWYWGEEAATRVHGMCRAAAHPAHRAVRGLAEMLPEGGMLAYLSYMAERVAVMHALLKDTGSLYFHCDPTASHYLKTILDCVFGAENFRNEIIWSYKTGGVSKRWFAKKHDVIFFYSKSRDYRFNPQKEKSYLSHRYGFANIDIQRDDKGDYREVFVRDVWDIAALRGNQPEALGYPTQKPLALLDRIVRASSAEGEVVLDPFCGCGTAAEAAWRLGRKFLGVDISPYAITRVCKDRLTNPDGVSVQGLNVEGLPGDMESARAMAAGDRFAFEHWVLSCLDEFAPNSKQVADGGIDGRGWLLNPPEGEKGACVAQVKSGRPSADALRAFLSQVSGGKFSMGVFITLDKYDTPTMREVASAAGTFRARGGTRAYNRILFWSIEEYFAGVEPRLPDMTDPDSGKPLQPKIPKG